MRLFIFMTALLVLMDPTSINGQVNVEREETEHSLSEKLNLSRDLRDGSRKRSGRDGGVSNTNNSNRSGKGVAKSDIVIFESLERAKERAPYLPPGGVFGIVIGGVTFILVAGAAAFQFLASLFNIDFSLTITPKDGTPSSVPSSMPSTSSPPSLAPSITNAPSLSPSSGPSR